MPPREPVTSVDTVGWSRPYVQRQAKVLGILLIVFGSLSILFNIVDLCIGIGLPGSLYDITSDADFDYFMRHGTVAMSTFSGTSLGVVGHGFWAGGMFIAAGIFGILSGFDRTACKVNAFLVLSVIGAVFAVVQTVVAGIGVAETDDTRREYHDKFGDCRGALYCQEVMAVFAMEILLLVFGVLAFIACVWSLILCCVAKGICATTHAASSVKPASRRTTDSTQPQTASSIDQQSLPWSVGRQQKVTTLYDEANENSSTQQPPAYPN